MLVVTLVVIPDLPVAGRSGTGRRGIQEGDNGVPREALIQSAPPQAGARLSGNLKDPLDLHDLIRDQAADAHRRARVAADLGAEYLKPQI